MNISVVIPTYNREQNLNECLVSILKQEILPLEVLVVDNARQKETDNVIQGLESSFFKKRVKIKYIENKKENSLTSARNMGTSLSQGDIVSFLDDDVVLTRNYLKKIIKFFTENKNALGVSGLTLENLYEENKIKFFVVQILGKLFFLGFREEKKCRVLPSLGVTGPFKIVEKIPSEWISGASSYRKEVFEEFYFDENLKKYSWGEDTDFSYRVNKKYPNSLFFSPKIRYSHKVSKEGRAASRELVYMEEIYNLYLFYKIIPQTLINKMIYIWSRIGRNIFRLLKFQFGDIFLSFSAYYCCLRNIRDIKKRNLDFFNNSLLNNNEI